MPLLVSVIVPCYNEEKTIGLLLDALVNQTYPMESIEVVIADGLSTDRTRDEIEKFQQLNKGLSVYVLDNPQRHIPAGLNIALQAAHGEVIVRLDAHSELRQDYIARCVLALAKEQEIMPVEFGI